MVVVVVVVGRLGLVVGDALAVVGVGRGGARWTGGAGLVAGGAGEVGGVLEVWGLAGFLALGRATVVGVGPLTPITPPVRGRGTS